MQLLASIPAFVWLLLSAICYACGEYFSKKFALDVSWKYFSFVIGAYMLGTLAWLPAIVLKNQLSTTGTAWLLLSMIATIGIGLLIFHERVSAMQSLGVILAAVALVFLNWHS